MSALQWAIVAAIHAEPRYRFVGPERAAASRMKARGWLKPSSGKTYSVTRRGERAFKNTEANHG